jgi:hypothetical protein
MFTTKVKEVASVKKSKHEIHTISGTDCAEYVELKNVIENATGKLKMLESRLKEEVKSIFIEKYNSSGKCPDNFKIQDDSGKNLLGIVMDKYISCDATKYEVLAMTNLVEQKTTFTFNSELLNKYQSVIENLLVNCSEIEDKDKENLIEGVLSFNVKKGAIEELSKSKDYSVQELYELIQPIMQLKVSN